MANSALLKKCMDNYCKVFEASLERRDGIFDKDSLDSIKEIEILESMGTSPPGLDEVRGSEIYGMSRIWAKRLGLEISDTAIIYLGYLCGLFHAPGDIVMYMGYLAWKAWVAQKNEKAPIRLDMGQIAEMLDYRAIPPEKMDEVWLSQKGANDCLTGNWLDMLSVETLTKLAAF